MKDRENIFHQAAVKVGLPGESIPGATLVELFGTNRVLIERHCGITGYSDVKICVRTVWGEIFVEGAKLKIACMSNKQLIITGDIISVYLNKRS